MNWHLNATISVFAAAGLILTFKRLQRTYPIAVYQFYTWIITAIFFGVVFVPTSTAELSWDIWLLIGIAGAASWLGNYIYNLCMPLQANLGYIEATVSSIRVATTYIVSLIFFGSIVEGLKFLGMSGILVGLVLITNQHRDKDHKSVKQLWIVWAVLSGTLLGLMIVISKLIFGRGLTPPVTLAFLTFVGAMFHGGTALVQKHSLRPQLTGEMKWLLLAGVLAIITNLALYNSLDTTPNLGYTTAISGSRMVLLYLASLMLGGDKLDLRKGVGVIITFISVILLAL